MKKWFLRREIVRNDVSIELGSHDVQMNGSNDCWFTRCFPHARRLRARVVILLGAGSSQGANDATRVRMMRASANCVVHVVTDDRPSPK